MTFSYVQTLINVYIFSGSPSTRNVSCTHMRGCM